MYKAEKQRNQEQVNYSSLDDFLLSLNIQVNLVVLQEIDLDRALQLTLRTNQFNLNGIRKTREEISKAIQDHTSLNWIIEVKDRFGNYGKAGLLLAKVDQDTLVIETFLLSCRVLGRNVEDIVLSEIQKYCDVQKLDTIIARFRSTSRNQPFLDFLLRRRWETEPYSNTYYFSVKNTGLTNANKHEYDLLNNPQAGSNEDDTVDLLDSKNRDTPQLTITLPATETEAALYNIWKNVLGHDNFGVNHDFFRTGGNSLKAVQLVSRISRHFLVDMQLTDIYFHSTISQLASLIPAQQKGLKSSVIEVLQRPEKIPLSFSQERLWFIDHLEGSKHYHTPEIFRLKGKVDKAALQYGLQTIVNRHEVLRTVIHDQEGQAFQYIKEKEGWALAIINGSQFKQDPAGLDQYNWLSQCPF
jgi:acyl carrier protein